VFYFGGRCMTCPYLFTPSALRARPPCRGTVVYCVPVLVAVDSVQALVQVLPLLVEVLEVGGTDDADEKSVVTFCLYGDVLLQLGIGAGADMRFHAEQLDAYERYFAQRFKEVYQLGM